MMNSCLKVVCMAAVGCLAACSKIPVHTVTGAHPIAQTNHKIELCPVELARTQNDKWYVASGPPSAPVRCLEFLVKLPSYQPPSVYEIMRVDVIRDLKEPVPFHRLATGTEERQAFDQTTHELWVLAQPSATALAPALPAGRYQVKIHYRLDGKEYDAEWKLVYEVGSKVVRWSFSH